MSTESPEAIRFGSTETSGSAVFWWAQQYASEVTAAVMLVGDSVSLVVNIDGEFLDLSLGDYLVRDKNSQGEYQFVVYTEEKWLERYGEAQQAIEQQPIIDQVTLETNPTPPPVDKVQQDPNTPPPPKEEQINDPVL